MSRVYSITHFFSHLVHDNEVEVEKWSRLQLDLTTEIMREGSRAVLGAPIGL